MSIHQNHFPFIGYYQHQTDSDVSNAEKSIQRHFYFQNKALSSSKTSLAHLDSIIQLCTLYNIKPILVTSPVHQSYFDNIPDIHKVTHQLVKEKFNKSNVIVLDFSQQFYPDSLYCDADHLNSKGASKFSKIIRERIR